MRVLVLGGDGYLGWPTALRFSTRGHEVAVVDNFARRRWHVPQSTDSLPAMLLRADRIAAWKEISGRDVVPYIGVLQDGEFVDQVIGEFLPEAVIHYGEQPSAPYSMISRRHAVETQVTNVVGTLNLLFA